MAVTVVCFSCGTKAEFPDKVGLREECEKCMADLHVCKNCRLYDETAYNECKEPSAEVCREKERANYCDYFEVGDGTFEKSNKDDLLAAAEALFAKKD
ncbi:MAG: hypothetical protein HRT44_09445 [Bdellovibrionales bacterium]|nr:hypothetical protein [Bdellovibrionales bacterium]NQZ19464.1 hypothetical protein [Bdellovibrionales bacterium]